MTKDEEFNALLDWTRYPAPKSRLLRHRRGSTKRVLRRALQWAKRRI